MGFLYRSTRNSEETATASEAILKGLANEGGLFVPDEIPALDVSFEELSKMNYREVAFEVMKLMLTDFTDEELRYCINSAYDSKFDNELIVPVKYHHGAYIMELFHGKTIAFKDMALSILPYLIAVFYPKNGVSPIQEKQMVTERGKNTFVAGITGNFDDAQTGVKLMFQDKALAEELNSKGFQFSSANSINIGRLVPQIVYYVYSYTRLIASGKIKAGDKINVVVPTGNFGNILAAYYASLMGMPVDRFICASNDNKVLYDFFTTGTYDRNREFILTSSPSMDILISSNLERLIYRIAGNSAEDNAEFMKQLSETGRYKITDQMKKNLFHFYGNFATSDEVAETIRKVYEEDGYIIDTHTAVAVNVYDKFKEETGDKDTPTLIASTASPYKFTRSVMTAIDPAYDAKGDFELVDELARLSAVTIPQAIEDIRSAEVLHKTVCDKEDMEKVVKGFLGI